MLVFHLLQQADGEAFEPCQVVRFVPISDATFIFAERDVQAPVQRVFDLPVIAYGSSELFDTEFKGADEVTHVAGGFALSLTLANLNPDRS